jgi:hypothetical protein
VVAEEDRAREGLVDALHHHQRAGEGSDERDVLRQLFDQQVLPVAVRVADDDFGGPGFERGLDGGVDFLRHELAEALVLEALRP